MMQLSRRLRMMMMLMMILRQMRGWRTRDAVRNRSAAEQSFTVGIVRHLLCTLLLMLRCGAEWSKLLRIRRRCSVLRHRGRTGAESTRHHRAAARQRTAPASGVRPSRRPSAFQRRLRSRHPSDGCSVDRRLVRPTLRLVHGEVLRLWRRSVHGEEVRVSDGL